MDVLEDWLLLKEDDRTWILPRRYVDQSPNPKDGQSPLGQMVVVRHQTSQPLREFAESTMADRVQQGSPVMAETVVGETHWLAMEWTDGVCDVFSWFTRAEEDTVLEAEFSVHHFAGEYRTEQEAKEVARTLLHHFSNTG